jgi:hypothetical protein
MGLRTWLLRRAMGRFRITDDIVRYLSTFQRLGETVEVQLPGELLPVGARTVFRAVTGCGPTGWSASSTRRRRPSFPGATSRCSAT